MRCPHRISRVLLKAVLISLALHLVAVAIFHSFSRSTADNSASHRVLQVSLRASEASGQNSAVAPAVFAEAKELPVAKELVSRTERRSIEFDQPTRPGQERHAGDALEAPRETTAVEADAEQLRDGIREYRLSLAKVAHRLKQYPMLAKENGWEGVSVLVVNTAAGMPRPLVSLSQSSGRDVLDLQALEMLNLAVQTAPLPDSLKGRQFGLTLPIHFSLHE